MTLNVTQRRAVFYKPDPNVNHIYIYRLGFSIYTNLAISAVLFTIETKKGGAMLMPAGNPATPTIIVLASARLLCVFAAGLWAVTLSFGCHCHPASASQLPSVLVWQWGQGYMGGRREEVTTQRGSWKHCPKLHGDKRRQRRRREVRHSEVTFEASGLYKPRRQE